MNKTWLLLKIQLLNFYGFNQMRYTKDKKEKFRLRAIFILLIFCFLYFGTLSFLYSYFMADAYLSMGVIDLLPGTMFFLVSVITLITTIYKINGTLFYYRDYDTLMSLPINTGAILASRILLLYVMNIALTLIVMVPCGIAFGIKTGAPFIYYLLFFLTLFFIPLIPIVIATFLGTIIAAIASRFQHAFVVNIILTLALVIASVGFSMNIDKFNMDQMASLNVELKRILYTIYPLTRLYLKSILDSDLFSLFLFVLISILFFCLYLVIISRNYKRITTGLSTHRRKSSFQWKELKPASQIMALYRKEFGRYFASPTYVLNTGVGIIMLLLMSIGMLLFDPSYLEQLFEIPGFSDLISGYAPIAISFIIVICCTTAASISIEGKNLWILKSLPITGREIFLSKLFVNLSLTIPCILISSTMIAYRLRPSLLSMLLLYTVPILYTIFTSILGLIMNLKFPQLNWTSEMTAVKQSASVMLTLLFSFAASFLPLLPMLLKIQIKAVHVTLITALLLLIIDAVLYRYLMNRGGHMLDRISGS